MKKLIARIKEWMRKRRFKQLTGISWETFIEY